MKGYLNHAQIEYVLYHLGQHFKITEYLINSFVFLKSEEETILYRNKVIFLLSDKKISFSEVKWVKDIPVLFPVSQKENFYYENDGNIIFNHDLLKSSFYLLSGFQEKENRTLDSMGRFEYESSVQAKLNIIHKPIVNYYFEEILEGIKEYCILRNIEFTRNPVFSGFVFFLTHDVDRVKYYNLNTFLYTTKLFFGLSKTDKNKKFLLKELFMIGINIINLFDRTDPWWNFKYLSDKEKKLGLHSTWFFLPKDQKHVDSYYRLKDKKIRNLMKFLYKEGHEIGLHGTVRSHNSFDALEQIKHQFYSATGQQRTGIRQHVLMWKHPDTAIIQDNAGIVYDSTLGFAAHEGFRNSYCHPFRLYDFENNRMLSYWEIPLTVMDSTLFHYRKLSIDDAFAAISALIKEIKKFNGVFTLLWHNSYLNESDVPGIRAFYDTLLKNIVAENPRIYTGFEIVNRLTEKSVDK